MFRNYFKVAFRNILKHKLQSGINILGLSIGIAVALLILLFVQNELNQDKFSVEEGKIYRAYRYFDDRTAGWVWSPPPLVDIMESEIPEVINASGLISDEDRLVDYKGKKIYAQRSAQVDSTFFLAVPLPFLYGDAQTALSDPSSIVISENLSRNLFGERNPIGEMVKMEGDWDYQIAGVLRGDTKTHLNYDVFSVMTWQQNTWTSNQNATYVRLADGVDLAAVEAKIFELVTPRILAEFEASGYPTKESEMSKWGLQPIEDIHLYSKNFTWNGEKRGDIRYLLIFLMIAGIVLLVAVINYTNLVTARVSMRAKEVGVRKVSGAGKRQLITQFLTESIVQSMIALLIAVMLAEFLLPGFNAVMDRKLGFLQEGFAGLIFPMLGIGLTVGLLAGAYPAFVLSGFKPVTVLKGIFKRKNEAVPLRKVLVIGQFALSISLIIIMSFIFKQVNYMLDQDLGFSAEKVMVVPLNLWDSNHKVKQLENAIKSVEGVQTVALSSMLPGEKFSHYTLKLEGREDPVPTNLLNANGGLDETLGLEVVEGRFLDEKQYGRDTLNNFVVNEAFVKKFNIEDPVGKQLGYVFDQEPGRIVGVIKDFHQIGLHEKIKPLVIVGGSFLMNVSMKVSTHNLKQTISDLEKVWTQVEPHHPMRYSFLDQDFATQYAEQERFGDMMLYATLLTIFIAIMGLFGLAGFAAERRTKEIGIRKVLGATTSNLIQLLVKDFVILILFAGVIALPLAYYFSSSWLQDFAYQTQITISPFILAFAIAFLLTILTVGYQALKTSLANPIEALRHD